MVEKAEKEQGPGTLGFSELRRQAGPWPTVSTASVQACFHSQMNDPQPAIRRLGEPLRVCCRLSCRKFTSIHSQRLSEHPLCALAVLGTVQGTPECGAWSLPGARFSLEGTKDEQHRKNMKSGCLGSCFRLHGFLAMWPCKVIYSFWVPFVTLHSFKLTTASGFPLE